MITMSSRKTALVEADFRAKVPVVKLSSLRPSLQLLIILFFYIQLFTSVSHSSHPKLAASPVSRSLPDTPNYRRSSPISSQSQSNQRADNSADGSNKVSAEPRSHRKFTLVSLSLSLPPFLSLLLTINLFAFIASFINCLVRGLFKCQVYLKFFPYKWPSVYFSD